MLSHIGKIMEGKLSPRWREGMLLFLVMMFLQILTKLILR